MGTYSYEDIYNKGRFLRNGLYDTLNEYYPTEVPSEISLLWETAQLQKDRLDETLRLIRVHFPEELQ